MTSAIPDSSTPFGTRVRDRLTRETVIWMTTVGDDGTPQPNPVWFLWEGGETILVYNRLGARRLDHLRKNPRVSLNLDGNGQGGDIVVLTGRAEIIAGAPLATGNPDYLAKYADHAARISGDVERFAQLYPVATRVTVTRLRGF